MMVVFVALLSFVFRAYWAWMMTFLWAWFVTPVFHISAPAVPLMFGLSMVVSGLTSYCSDADVEVAARRQGSDKWLYPLISSLTMNVLTPTAAVAIGFLIVKVFGPL